MLLAPPFESLQCNLCRTILHFPPQTFSYTHRRQPQSENEGDFEVHPILTTRAWCIACNAPTYAERVPSFREFELATAIVRRQEDFPRNEIEDDLLDLGREFGVGALRYWQHCLSGRKVQSRCLMCGSERLIAGGRDVHMQHAECGGDLGLESYHFSHHPGRGPVRFYGWDGEFLWEQHEQHSPPVLGKTEVPAELKLVPPSA